MGGCSGAAPIRVQDREDLWLAEEAEREARTSPYLTARPLEWVRAENERLSQPDEFTSELHEWSQGASGKPPVERQGVEW